ncbi:sporulation integral membrane protein YtvI [Bacillus sp. T33-2]|uniref:sporulation integral membrane protein YtvI n=1 Tax=Bacillus sp. T33-2 TaxID=2054168 RepID=UPI000C75EBBE|nr:sporulation integral membrane protein YtvI [Bacillus sp. T33-2]PLR97734.1 sporulation integral membrane protein YtvI [Bacillus sp. T33-2]
MRRYVSKRAVFILLGTAVTAALSYVILPVSFPLIIAFVSALFLEPAVRYLHKQLKITRRLSVLIIFILFVLFIGVSGYFIATKVITEAVKMVENAPLYLNELTNIWFNTEARFIEEAKNLPDELVDDISRRAEEFLINIRNDLIAYININNLKTWITNIPNYLVSFLVYLIALFLLLLDLPRLRQAIYSHLTEKTADKVRFMTSRLSYVLFGFIKAQLLVSVIIFIVSFLGLLLIVPDIALFMALFIWLIDFIPVFGTFIILGPWALFHLLTGDIALGSQLAILAAAVLIIRRTVEPKVMGSHIGLSALSTLVAMYLGLKIIGIAGIFIGPLIIIAYNSAKEAGMIKINFKI